jgi:hypothetical protein
MNPSGHVTVVGRVARVRRNSGGWRVRLTDTGGTLAAAEFRPFSHVVLPRVGARIIIHGRLRYDDQHGWYTIDPVEAWRETSEL